VTLYWQGNNLLHQGRRRSRWREGYAGLLKIAASQGDAILRLDRRVERIEKRLELVEA